VGGGDDREVSANDCTVPVIAVAVAVHAPPSGLCCPSLSLINTSPNEASSSTKCLDRFCHLFFSVSLRSVGPPRFQVGLSASSGEADLDSGGTAAHFQLGRLWYHKVDSLCQKHVTVASQPRQSCPVCTTFLDACSVRDIAQSHTTDAAALVQTSSAASPAFQ